MSNKRLLRYAAVSACLSLACRAMPQSEPTAEDWKLIEAIESWTAEKRAMIRKTPASDRSSGNARVP